MNINHLLLNWILSLKNLANKKKIDFAVGGQAVIEGVMMRSLNNITIAVRKPNGKIKVKKKHYKALVQRVKWLNIPIIRGIINLFEMMIIGTKAINYSANESMEEPAPAAKSVFCGRTPQKFFTKITEILMAIVSFIIAISLALFLFKFIPLWTTTFLEEKSAYIQQNYLIFNLIDGILKTAIFLLYIFILSLIPAFRRVFEYHGSEHKSIFTYENKFPLTVENAKKQSRFHPRCGTSFIFIVFAISILVYTFVPKQPEFWINLSLRIAFLPIIAGISYEYLKISAKYNKKAFIKVLIAPGLWFQRLTTKEPDSKQLEVGLKSLKEALAAEKILI